MDCVSNNAMAQGLGINSKGKKSGKRKASITAAGFNNGKSY